MDSSVLSPTNQTQHADIGSNNNGTDDNHAIDEFSKPSQRSSAASSELEGQKEQNKSVLPKRRKGDHSSDDDICSTSEFLSQRAQELVNEINVKRNNDTSLVRDFKKAFEAEIENCSARVEKALFQVCEKNSSVIQNKLQELYCTIDEIGKLERELLQFKEALSALYSDVQNPEP